ncbi:39S ribosomal protein L43, mitochondrial [Harpegnathos saltator]|uniref:Large ribosomal subunit protein mL43 n=1 Tax=Harpegnathos saltator TaxID=610380 RepID=E2BZW8_HARSA|nr:39S ribosomal protein L43, mitochondrial [Harpegnathos saltator]EFN78745.1 39S ribosomal protein L43, mitochondrial [Harpegnathos saltator]
MSHRHLFLKSGFLRAPHGLGIGRYVCQLQRVTLKFCKSHGTSMGMRHFIEHNLIHYAKENPGIVVYVKPRRHRHPVIVAEYLNGGRQWMDVANYNQEDIIKWMELLRTQIHDSASLRLRKLWHTEFPSIQGPWTPFFFKDPMINLVHFPNKEHGAAVKLTPTATEQLIQLFKAQQLQDNTANDSQDTERVETT